MLSETNKKSVTKFQTQLLTVPAAVWMLPCVEYVRTSKCRLVHSIPFNPNPFHFITSSISICENSPFEFVSIKLSGNQ